MLHHDFPRKSVIDVLKSAHTKSTPFIILSVHSGDTANFWVLWPDWPHPFLIIPNQKCFDQLLIYMNLHHMQKNLIDVFWRYGSLKNSEIWLAEIILSHISGKKISQTWNLCRNTANSIIFHYQTNSVTTHD